MPRRRLLKRPLAPPPVTAHRSATCQQKPRRHIWRRCWLGTRRNIVWSNHGTRAQFAIPLRCQRRLRPPITRDHHPDKRNVGEEGRQGVLPRQAPDHRPPRLGPLSFCVLISRLARAGIWYGPLSDSREITCAFEFRAGPCYLVTRLVFSGAIPWPPRVVEAVADQIDDDPIVETVSRQR
jgi:hypothetical protein